MLFSGFTKYAISNLTKKSAVNCILNEPIVLVPQILDAQDSLFLNKIISAINRQLIDQNVMVISEGDVLDFSSFDNESIKIAPMICSFGVDAEQLGLPSHLSLHKKYAFEGFSYFQTYGLNTLKTDISKKKELWLALKSIFNS